MPAPLSIIIPALNAASDLPLCLESLMAGLEAGLIREVIVADSGSEDATRAIAGSAGANLVEAGPSSATRRRAGADAARGEWLLFLHPDAVLSRDWPERAAAHMAMRPGMAAAFRLKYRSDARAARVAEARANRRARWLGLPMGDQGLLISRALYDEAGGYPDIAAMEDAELARRIGKARLVMLDAEARVSAARHEQAGWGRIAAQERAALIRFLMRR
ncbi:MAG: glycosyltransferase [Hyphomonas sp.]